MSYWWEGAGANQLQLGWELGPSLPEQGTVGALHAQGLSAQSLGHGITEMSRHIPPAQCREEPKAGGATSGAWWAPSIL